MKEYNKTEFEDMHRNNASLVQRELNFVSSLRTKFCEAFLTI